MAAGSWHTTGPAWRKTSTGWDLYFNGTKIATLDSNGNLKTKGDVSANDATLQ